MAPVTYSSVCDEIYDQLSKRLERKNDESLRFASRGTTVQVMHDGNLQLFYRSLSTGVGPESRLQITEQDFIERVKERQLQDFLATLIFATCSIAAARAFVTKLVATRTWPIRDRRGATIGSLPADLRQLVAIFGSHVDADKFFAKQASFQAVTLRKGEEVSLPSLTSRRLPYLEESPLGEGSFGKVSRVRIATGHFEDADTEFGHNTAPMWMARKDYTLTENVRVRDEHEIMKKILSQSSKGHVNIIESFGSLSIGNNYSLFMELAVCDLRSYMMEHHPTRPNTREAKAEIIRSAEGLADGLNYLHSGMKTPELEDMVCYHMDLTPSNILVFVKKEGDYFRPIWKLSDFGMSRVKIRHSSQGGERERDFNSLFVRRRKVQNSTLSPTLNRRGEGTYLAPESINAIPHMKTGSDVWSLGCVLSVVFSYLQDGYKGVATYQDARIQHRDADGYDRFFLRGHRFNPTRVHDEVSRWHTQLIKKAEARDTREGQAIKYMLRNLEKSVLLIDPSDRISAKKVKNLLATTFKIYTSPEDTNDEKHFQIDMKLDIPTDFSWNRFFSRKQSASQGNVNEWSLSSNESFKGCAISPDAMLVAYWTDVKIVLFSSQSLIPRKGHKEGHDLTRSAEYSLDATESFWKSVSLTNEYLIASTTGRGVVYIFDLHAGTPVDADLNRLNLTRVTLPFPEIHKLSISPNSEMLACVLRHQDGDRHPGSLLCASLSDLIALATPRPSVSTEGVSLGSTRNASTPMAPWRILQLGSPAADVIHLTISDAKDVHIVIRPDLTARSREHKIPVMQVSLRNSTIDTLLIESRGFDSSGTAGLFTTFCPFGDGATCAVVTREKRFHIQTFTGNDPIDNMQKEIPNFRVLKLIAGLHDEKFFALGTSSANHRVRLLEIAMPQPNVELCVREIAQFTGLSYGDDFTGVLSEENGEKFALIATLAGANRPKMYKVCLSGGAGAR